MNCLALRKAEKILLMLKQRRDRVAIFTSMIVFFIAFCTISFATDKHREVHTLSKEIKVSPDFAFIDKMMKKYEELKWFEPATLSQLENEAPSLAVFGKKISSFDRAIMGLKMVHLFLNGKYEDYLEFVSSQDKGKRLEWLEFEQIQNLFSELISRIKGVAVSDVIEVLEFCTILNEIGDAKKTRDKALLYEIKAWENEALIDQIVHSRIEIFPTAQHFSLPMKKLVSELVKLRVFHEMAIDLQRAYSAFEEAKEHLTLVADQDILDLSFFLHLCLVAASYGDQNPISAPHFTRYTYRNLQTVKKALTLLLDNSEDEVYQFYLDKRADLLDVDPRSPLNRIVTVIGSMMQLYTKEEGKALKETFLRLPPDDLALIVSEFDEVKSEHASTTLAPFLVNLVTSVSSIKSSKDRIAESVLIGFPVFVKATRLQRMQEEVVPLDFEPVFSLARKNPNALKQADVRIDEKGRVLIQ